MSDMDVGHILAVKLYLFVYLARRLIHKPMEIAMTINSKTFVASTADITKLMEQRLAAGSTFKQSKDTYLRALIGTAQDRLGLSVLRTPRKAAEYNPQELEALEAVHTEFYEAVQTVAKSTPLDDDETRDKATVLGSRCAFARSAYSTIRAWMVRGKHSLASIVAAKTTKTALAADTPKRATASPMARGKQLRTRPLITKAEGILGVILTAAKTDKQKSVQALHDVVMLLIKGFDDLGMPSSELQDMLDHTATVVEPTAPVRRVRVRQGVEARV